MRLGGQCRQSLLTCHTGSSRRPAGGTVFAILLSHDLRLCCKMLCGRDLLLPAREAEEKRPRSGIRLARRQLRRNMSEAGNP